MTELLSLQQIIAANRCDATPRCGIYFLLKNDAVVYVGQSVNVGARIQQHRTNKEFDSFSVIECAENELDAMEQDYIQRLVPPLNKRPGRKPLLARALTTGDKQRKRRMQFKMMMSFIIEVSEGAYGDETAKAARRLLADIKDPSLGVKDALQENRQD